MQSVLIHPGEPEALLFCVDPAETATCGTRNCFVQVDLIPSRATYSGRRMSCPGPTGKKANGGLGCRSRLVSGRRDVVLAGVHTGVSQQIRERSRRLDLHFFQ